MEVFFEGPWEELLALHDEELRGRYVILTVLGPQTEEDKARVALLKSKGLIKKQDASGVE